MGSEDFFADSPSDKALVNGVRMGAFAAAIKDEAQAAALPAAAAAALLVHPPREAIHLGEFFDPARVPGTTDDAAAITAAIAALPAAGGTLILGRNQLRVASAVSINKPVLILGAHHTQTTITVTATKLFGLASDDITICDVGFLGASMPDGGVLFAETSAAVAYSGWTFERCRFDACGSVRITKPGRLQADGSTAAAGTGAGSNVKIVDCEVTGIRSAYAIELGCIDGVHLDNVHVHDNGVDTAVGEGVKVLAGSTNVRVSNCHLHHNTRDGLDAYDALHVTLVGNDVHDNGVNGVEVKWTTTDANPVEHLVMVGNKIHNNAADGANVGVPHSAITANVVWDNGASGIRFGSAVDVPTGATIGGSLTGNVCEGNTLDGIRVGNTVTGLTITGNQCRDNGNIGIALNASVSDVTLVGNQAFGNAVRGIHVLGAGITLSGNRSQDADGSAYIDATATNVVRSSLVPARSYKSTVYYWPDGTRGAFATTASRLTVCEFDLEAAQTLVRIGCEVTVAAASSVVRLGIYAIGADGLPSTLILDAGTVDSSTIGAKELTISQALAPGRYGLAAAAQGGTPTVRTVTGGGAANVGAGSLATATGSTANTGYYMSGVTGALPSTFTLTDRTPTPTLVVVRV